MLSSLVGRFELLAPVGEGGYGVVYEARDARDGGRVAVKVLQASDAVAVRRFSREASLLAELSHPSVVRYIDHGSTAAGQGYIAMEWLEGKTLAQVLREERLAIVDAIALSRRLIEGLAFAAERGIVHRDLKPANVFLVGGTIERAKLLDFGLARRLEDDQELTLQGVVVGTPVYMSPEQARGHAYLDARSDVFSLGSVLYQCLTGVPPFEGSGTFATLAKICLHEAPRIETLRPHVPARLCALVHAMLEKNPAARPGYSALLGELERITGEYEEVARSGPSDRSDEPPSSGRSSLRARTQQRVLCALLIGPVQGPSAARKEALDAELRSHGASCERLLDGSRVVLFDRQLGPGEQAIAAASCALAVRSVLRSAPFALCTGRALVEGRVPLGELIDRGAALLRGTPESGIGIDDTTAGLIEARYEVSGPEGERRLLRERVGGEAPRTLLGRVTPFVGRERELSQLELSFDACLEEQTPQVVLVTAAAGAGKSRLRFELIERLRKHGHAFTLLIGRGDSVRTGTPFGLIAPALRAWAELLGGDSLELQRKKLRMRVERLLPAERAQAVAEFLGEMIGVPYSAEGSAHLSAARRDPQVMADRMLSSWLEWLEALSAQQPVVFVAEDLHWSDLASVRYLDAALRVLAGRALFLLALARPEVKAGFPSLFAGRGLLEMHLQKLGPKPCERLLESLAGETDAETRAALLERADGNPFFLEELVRGLRAANGSGEELPDTILGIVQARLDALGEDAKLVLRCASVYGQTFALSAVAALLPGATELDACLQTLIEREVIFARGELPAREYVFRHALLRDAAYALLPDEERSLAHRLAGQWLERGGSRDAALLASHYERGRAQQEAARWYGVAAVQALEASSLGDVLNFGERAMTCGLEGEPLAEVGSMLAEAASYAGQNDLAREWAEASCESVPVSHPAWWRAAGVLALTEWRLGHVTEGNAVAERMVAELACVPLGAEQVIALGFVATNAIDNRDVALGERILALIDRECVVPLGARAEATVHLARFVQCQSQAELSGALRHVVRMFELNERAGSARDAMQALMAHGGVLCDLGSYEAAELYLQEAAQRALRIGADPSVLVVKYELGRASLARGNASDAVRHFREAAEGFGKQGHRGNEGCCMGLLSVALYEAGALSEAELAAWTALELLAPFEPSQRALPLAALAQVELRRGELAFALEHANEALAVASGARHGEAAVIRVVHAECLFACNRSEAARAAAEQARIFLFDAAAKIHDAGHRQSFLHNVPAHARILALSQR